MTKFVTLDIDLKSLDRLARGLKGYRRALLVELHAALVDTLVEIERVAKEKCPVKTGRLRSSIAPDVRSATEGYVGTNVDYAADVEYGTKAHEIVARHAKALRFHRGGTPATYKQTKSGKFRRIPGEEGELTIVKRVQHPGTPAQPFMEPAYRHGEKAAKRHYDDAMRRLQRLVSR